MISQSTSEAVSLLHGLTPNRLAMLLLAKQLTPQSFHVENWGYPSICSWIEIRTIDAPRFCTLCAAARTVANETVARLEF